MSAANEQHARPLTGYFVFGSPSDKPPHSELGISIEWHRRSIEDASVFQALNFEVIATTQSDFATAYDSITHRPSHSGPFKPTLRLDVQHESQWTSQLDQMLINHLPVRCLGPITTRSAAVADHIFFTAQNSTLYDVLLLTRACGEREIRKRFRQWSTHLHPDRFELKKNQYPGLTKRLQAVYDRVCEAYRTLNNPYKRALHDYWLDQGDKNRAIALDENEAIAELNRISEVSSVRTELISALRCTYNGRWHESATILNALLSAFPQNR